MDNIDVRIFRQFLRHFERELNVQNNSSCCCGVTLTQCHTLMELYINDGIQLNELSGKLHLDKSTVSRTVESLVNQQLISREIPKTNRRTTVLKLTEQGQNVCEQIHDGNDEYFEKAISAIPKEMQSNFMKSFEIIVNKMIELNELQ